MRMNEQSYEKLEAYWYNCRQKKKQSDKIAAKISYICDNDRWKNVFLFDVIRKYQMLIYFILEVICEKIEHYQRKKHLSRLLGLKKDDIAVDVNDLLKKREKIRCYGSDFTYSVVSSKKYLKNIEVIFGDAHLEALDDITCLCNLKKVTGKIYFLGKKFEDISEIK